MHSGTRLLNDVYPDKFRKAMEDKVRGRGVTLVDQDYVDVFPPADAAPADLATRAGKTLKDVALVVPAFEHNAQVDGVDHLTFPTDKPVRL